MGVAGGRSLLTPCYITALLCYGTCVPIWFVGVYTEDELPEDQSLFVVERHCFTTSSLDYPLHALVVW